MTQQAEIDKIETITTEKETTWRYSKVVDEAAASCLGPSLFKVNKVDAEVDNWWFFF